MDKRKLRRMNIKLLSFESRIMDIVRCFVVMLFISPVSVLSADLCSNTAVVFNQPSSMGSQNYGGTLSISSAPLNTSALSHEPHLRTVCQCRIAAPDVFDFMLKPIRTNLAAAQCLNSMEKCQDRIEIEYKFKGGGASPWHALLSRSVIDSSADRSQPISEVFKENLREVTIRYIDQPDGLTLVNYVDIEAIATSPLVVSCGFRFENIGAGTTGDRPPASPPPPPRGEKHPEEDGAWVVVLAVIAIIVLIAIAVIIAVIIKGRVSRKTDTNYLSSGRQQNRPRSGAQDTRYVSLETMQQAKGRAPEINDDDATISFDKLTSKSNSNATTPKSLRGTSVAIDIPNASEGATGGAEGGYDYIETVDYYKQIGSEPTSPETFGLLGSDLTSPISASGYATSSPTSQQNDDKTGHSAVEYENLTSQNDKNNTYLNQPNSDNTELYQNIPQSVQDSNKDKNGGLVESDKALTKENGYGKGAIPKRPTEYYHQIWNNEKQH